MSKICIIIPEECKTCYKLCIEYCPTGINIQPKLPPFDKYYLFVVDHFGNVWRDQITINEDGSFDIDLSNYPSGFFTSTSGAVNIFLSSNEDGSNPIDMTFDGTVYNCVLISTQPNVDFVDEDVTIFNPGVSSCGVIPGWTVVWGNIEGDILNQTDLIEYIANATTGYITCEDLPDCQTIIDINNTLAGKFDIPIGTASEYLDGTGTPTPFPSIPAQYNPTAGTGISITGSYPNQTITNTDPDQIIVLTGGTAILITGTYPNFTIDNLSPDQIVSLTNGTGISVSGTYPNFTIDNTLPDQVVNLSNGTGISITGTYPNFTITNSNPDQVVSLSAGTGISITGTYPNFTITSTVTGTVTSVTATSPLFSSGGTTPNITIQQANSTQSGYLSSGDWSTFNNKVTSISGGTGISIGGTTTIPIVTNTAPDQTVTLTAGTGISVSGTYPSFTITNTSTSGGLQHGTASGIDTYTTTITGVTSYADGDAYLIRFTNGNTVASPTLNINGLGAITLYRNNDGQLIGGDILDGAEMLCVYNSTLNVFQCIGTSPNTIFSYVTNGDVVPITKGQPVYAFSGTGDRMVVKLAANTSDATSARTVGLVYSTSIGVNQKGLIITEGLLDGLSIVSPVGGWSDGSVVYLGATAGSITPTKPYAPNHLVYLGIVTTASPGSAGRISVKVQNGYELEEIHDVDLISVAPVNNDVLTYVTGSPDLWKPRSVTTILGYTPVTNSRNINTTSPLSGGGNLTADRTLSINQATTLTDGYLSSVDWNTFNSKLSDNAWVDYSATSTITGWSSFTLKELRYKLVGDTLFINYIMSGTSNSTTTTFTLPYVSNTMITTSTLRCLNNGTNFQAGATVLSTASLVAFSYWSALSTLNSVWTASGTKQISGQFFIQIGTTTLDFDAQNFISYAGITDATQRSAINQLVIDLKAYNLWNKCTCIYPWVGGTATAHSLNLKNPTLFPLTFTAGWTHTSLGGTPTNAYANLGFAPSTVLTANNTHLSVYMGTDTAAGNKVEMAVGVGGSLVPYIGLYVKYTGNFCYSNAYNLSTNQITAANTDRRGHYIGSRTSSTLHKLYKNGSVIGTDTNTNSNSLPTLNIVIGCLNSNGTFVQYTDGQFRFSSIGEGFNDTEALNFRTAVQAFQTTLGRQV